MREPFRFKQFSVTDSKCALKVGTDAVLLGAWADPHNSNRILDIGTGSGIIALMLAQRSLAEIEAIDIDRPSFKDATVNFKNSPWKDRLFSKNLSFTEFLNEGEKNYDLIVSNPPFHNRSLQSSSLKGNISKHTTSLTHEELATGVRKILKPTGKFCIILPFSEYQNFKQLAAFQVLYVGQECFVIPKIGKPANRILIEFRLQHSPELKTSEITIRNSAGNYHKSYIELTKDFYLNF